MHEVVVRGIVEVMNDRQLEERTRSLQSALGRMSDARAARTGDVAVIDFGAGESTVEEARRRRRLFRFGDRARSAVEADDS